MVVFPLCPVLGSRPVELAWVWCLSIVSGGSARPRQVVVGEGRLSRRLLQPCSCPDCLASPCVSREGELLWISSVTSQACGRLGYCHGDWLERCAFGVCTPAARTCARAACA